MRSPQFTLLHAHVPVKPGSPALAGIKALAAGFVKVSASSRAWAIREKE